MQDDEFSERTSNWPDAVGTEPTTITVDFEPRIDEGSTSIRFVKVIRSGDLIALEEMVWEQDFANPRLAQNVFDWMLGYRNDWPLWGRLTSLLGPGQLIEVAKARISALRVKRAAELVAKRNEDRTKRELEKVIESYLVEDAGQFGIDLRRGGHDEAFFTIWFREKWERERFRDWFRTQRHRFVAFAAMFDEEGAGRLERRLLREMQETEIRIKRAGLGAGGRRPLRFYRGEE
ncbi:hypothetical protein [Sphingomonas sp. SAFR-052]|uniref:hypothetical protein n=1 Tax=Sphingomonas sp. SAFR-052 TaxID=3436867 RepID=UPI003F807B5A